MDANDPLLHGQNFKINCVKVSYMNICQRPRSSSLDSVIAIQAFPKNNHHRFSDLIKTVGKISHHNTNLDIDFSARVVDARNNLVFKILLEDLNAQSFVSV